ncbi:LLM class flavin-dependent oxidoreductase [Paraburkholderia silvatlantica]|uniref:Alkanesulfonate monooxygenase SsuD/methylene tetrahydromethanopterin reductase-like flavin-dependent oxidoreductase (Luciferase family) n=1 Tax=Paraburkholderia silvatlantica TaxID=321895 RepID=A0A2U1A675_9BURK|nr:LLM class flavin-dependent oxidoreductase [Paraburkholderia silvatlantica]MBB2929228.1 alkanesulfonate monooxygenase SsuD/methylene tetrahydromethanopterin reductase-like flavin-dependent oxidoreductase (luciferase family) [Paraburkholderia silvatlantica]PVY27257.1 alkanesulfonate monooxygenase SsuD/methylene tetrahydromethanopterin reductase-like flavin-dependent oxidoreductase (luciferase family) [Paraburkholderia silvatlantica]PXW34286.1 alkanesulfonate monooxygenase SsuD/methylene tetrahy
MKFGISLSMERFSPDDSMSSARDKLLMLARVADASGFETLWTAEHHTIECTISPNPFTVLTWLAQHTERIRLGTATIVAPYWSPIRLAGEAAMCDHLTNGRLELGIARGAYQYEFDRMAGGMPQQEGVAYMKELLPAVHKLWEGDYAHDGHYWKFPLATSVPKPLQQPHPPIWVATRDPGSFDWAVGVGANILSTPLSAPAGEVSVLGQKFRKAVADHPERPRPRFMMLRRTCVYERPEDWQSVVRYSVDYGRYFENLMQNIGTVRDGFPEAVPYETVANRANYDPQAIRENLMFGTPDEVIRKLQIYEDEGVDQFCLGLSFNLPFELQMKTLRLFADEVIPHFARREKAAAGALATTEAGN